MKRISLLLGVMLMSICPLLTSCVDSDMYEMYDEDGLFIPRVKKSKDNVGGNNGSSLESLYPRSQYPLLYESSFFYHECAACAYWNIKKCSYAEARVAIIRQQYGNLNINTYNTYFNSVNGNKIDDLPIADHLKKALGSTAISFRTFVNDVRKNNGVSTYTPIAIKAPLHMATVTSWERERHGYDLEYETYTFNIKDQYPSDSSRPSNYPRSYHVTIYITNEGTINENWEFIECDFEILLCR